MWGARRKGFWHIVESVLGAMLLIGVLLVVSRVLAPVEPTDFTDVPFLALGELADAGLLHDPVAANDTAAINALITLFTFNYTAQICDRDLFCSDGVPAAKNIWIGSRLVAGNDTYDPKIVKLAIWRTA